MVDYGFSSGHVWVWELDHKQSWVLRNWYFWTAVLEKTLKSCLDFKEVKQVNPKGNQPRIFIVRADVGAEAPILWPPDAKNWLFRKDPVAGKRLKAGGEGGDRGWDGWMTSPTRWLWIWLSSRSWWWTVKPGVLQLIGSQKAGHDWMTELN